MRAFILFGSKTSPQQYPIKSVNGYYSTDDPNQTPINDIVCYLSDFVASRDGWAGGGTEVPTFGNSIGGENDCLELRADLTGGVHRGIRAETLTPVSITDIQFKYYAPSGQTNFQYLWVNSEYDAPWLKIPIVFDSWQTVTIDDIAVSYNNEGNGSFWLDMAPDDITNQFTRADANDGILYLKDIRITWIAQDAYLKNRGMSRNAVANYQVQAAAWSLKDRTIVRWYQRAGCPYSTKDTFWIVSRYNDTAQEMSEINDPELPTHDIHSVGALFGSGNRAYYLKNTFDVSVYGECIVFETDVGFNVNNWTRINKFGTNLQYNQCSELGGFIYVISQQRERALFVHRTPDLFRTVQAMGELINVDPARTLNQWVYQNVIYNRLTGTIHILVGFLKADGPNRIPELWYLKTNDGVTFQNHAETWSKQPFINGYITQAEASANLVIKSLPDTDYQVCRSNHAFLDDNGKIWGICGNGNAENQFQMFTDESGVFVFRDIDTSGYHILTPWDHNAGWLKQLDANTFDVFLIDDKDQSGLHQLAQFRTTDKGLNWTFIKYLTTAETNNHRMLIGSPNQDQFGHGVILSGKQDLNQEFTEQLFIERI